MPLNFFKPIAYLLTTITKNLKSAELTIANINQTNNHYYETTFLLYLFHRILFTLNECLCSG